MYKNLSDIVSNGHFLLDRRARWLAFPPTIVITDSGPPDIGYITSYLYGCSLSYCINHDITCNHCPYVVGFYPNIFTL